MARPLRIQVSSAIYHAMARGNGRQRIFRDERDYGGFFEGLETTVDKFGFEVFSVVCMPNHVHVFFRAPEPHLSGGMQYLLAGYDNWFNTVIGVRDICFRVATRGSSSKTSATSGRSAVTCELRTTRLGRLLGTAGFCPNGRLHPAGGRCTFWNRAYTHDFLKDAPMTTEGEIPMALRAAYLTLHRRSEARFTPYGVTADQFVLLATLARGGTLTQRELARRMPSDPSTVRAMLVLLEDRGLVQRDRHPTDSRARAVALTPAGRRKLRQLWNAGESIRSQMIDALEPDEVETLVRLLRKIAASLDTEGVPVG